jgi:hypothetical protein
MLKLKRLFTDEWHKPKTTFDKVVNRIFIMGNLLAIVWWLMYFFVWK